MQHLVFHVVSVDVITLGTRLLGKPSSLYGDYSALISELTLSLPPPRLCSCPTGSSFVVSEGSYLDISDWLNPAKLSLYYQINATSPWVRDLCGQRTTDACEQLCDQETGKWAVRGGLDLLESHYTKSSAFPHPLRFCPCCSIKLFQSVDYLLRPPSPQKSCVNYGSDRATESPGVMNNQREATPSQARQTLNGARLTEPLSSAALRES